MPIESAPVLPEELVRGVMRLEPLPVTARRLLELANGKDVSLAKIAQLIEFDPAVAAAVLRHASTAQYATHAAPTVHEAVMRMGTVALLDLVMDGYLKKLRAEAPMYDLREQDLWVHGAAAELAVRALAIERPQLAIPPLTETAALLHDIGKLIMSRYLKTDARKIVQHARTRAITFVEAERDLLGVDHAAVGAAMAEHWQFPREVVEAIRYHHSTPFARPTVVLDAVSIANVVAKTIEAGLGAEGLNFSVDPATYQRLGIDFAVFGRVCLQTDVSLRKVAAAHGVPL